MATRRGPAGRMDSERASGPGDALGHRRSEGGGELASRRDNHRQERAVRAYRRSRQGVVGSTSLHVQRVPRRGEPRGNSDAPARRTPRLRRRHARSRTVGHVPRRTPLPRPLALPAQGDAAWQPVPILGHRRSRPSHGRQPGRRARHRARTRGRHPPGDRLYARRETPGGRSTPGNRSSGAQGDEKRTVRGHRATERESVDDYLADPRALLATGDYPEAARRRVVPGLCRNTLEAACVDTTRRRLLLQGRSHTQVEVELEQAGKLLPRLALALFGDAGRAGDVLADVNRRWGRTAGDCVQALQRGSHRLIDDEPDLLVSETARIARGILDLA